VELGLSLNLNVTVKLKECALEQGDEKKEAPLVGFNESRRKMPVQNK
jgi:hypothetical protein